MLEEGLLLEAPFSYYESTAGEAQDRFEARRASPFVGGVLATAQYRGDLLLVATNHAELVRLRSDWETIDTIHPFTGRDEDDLPLVQYGSLLIEGDSLFVSYRVGSEIGISEIDLPEWEVTRDIILPGRYGAFPQSCFIDSEHIALVSTGGVSIVDRSTLKEEEFKKLDGSPSGLACAEGHAWVSDLNTPQGWVLRPDGSVPETFSWDGDGSSNLTFSPNYMQVFGSDPVSDRVFACDIQTTTCEVSDQVGDKPTDLLVHDQTLYVTTELTQAVALVEVDTLSLVGSVDVPGSPRTLTRVQPP